MEWTSPRWLLGTSTIANEAVTKDLQKLWVLQYLIVISRVSQAHFLAVLSVSWSQFLYIAIPESKQSKSLALAEKTATLAILQSPPLKWGYVIMAGVWKNSKELPPTCYKLPYLHCSTGSQKLSNSIWLTVQFALCYVSMRFFFYFFNCTFALEKDITNNLFTIH